MQRHRPSYPTTSPPPSAAMEGEPHAVPSRPELALAWALLAAAVLAAPGPSRLHAAAQVAALVWAARLTLHRSRRASAHAAVVIACVVGIDVLAAVLPGLSGR